VYAFSTFVEDPIGDIIRRSAGVLRCPPEAIYPGAEGGGAGARLVAVLDMVLISVGHMRDLLVSVLYGFRSYSTYAL
jgi:hypothetical protein